jgi:hypothetical protein
MVHGELRPGVFGIANPTAVIFLVNSSSNVNSVSFEFPVDYKPGEEGFFWSPS